MTRGRVALAVVAAVAAVVGLVELGSWEGTHHADEEMRGMRRVLTAIGPLDNSTLSMYRIEVGFGFDCLLYRRGENRFALEVCVDRHGRVIETIDRRGSGDPTIASLREDPSASEIRVDRNLVHRLLQRLGAPGV